MITLALLQLTAATVSPVSAPVATDQPAKIVMYRPGALMGMAIACPIRYHGEELIELGRGKYAEWNVPAGSYVLNNKTASVEVNVKPGQTKYVRCQVKTGFMTGRADLQIVDRESFEKHQAGFERKEVATLAIQPE